MGNTARWLVTPLAIMLLIHDRMPVILQRPIVDHWLDPDVSDPGELKPMLTQYPSDEMQAWPVGKAVGNARNQGPQLMERIDGQVELF